MHREFAVLRRPPQRLINYVLYVLDDEFGLRIELKTLHERQPTDLLGLKEHHAASTHCGRRGE